MVVAHVELDSRYRVIFCIYVDRDLEDAAFGECPGSGGDDEPGLGDEIGRIQIRDLLLGTDGWRADESGCEAEQSQEE